VGQHEHLEQLGADSQISGLHFRDLELEFQILSFPMSALLL
jgi:hypothetical protein